MSSIDIRAALANDPTLLAAVSTGRGGAMVVAVLVALATFALVPWMASAFQAALAVAVEMFLALLRVAGIGVVALVVIGLLLLW